MKIFGNAFDLLTWRVRRELRNNRKPIILFFSNGYESQLLLAILHRLGKRPTLVHLRNDNLILPKKLFNVLNKYKFPHYFLRGEMKDKYKKSFSIINNFNTFTFEDISCGFSSQDYLLIADFQIGCETSLLNSFFHDMFDKMYCPLLRCCDSDIERYYQAMKDNYRLGKFLFQNITSDSIHNNFSIR